MTTQGRQSVKHRHVLTWLGRALTLLLLALLLLFVFEDGGRAPLGWREALYLGLFPFGFMLAHFLAWRYPLTGGITALLCMGLSQLVTGRIFNAEAYVIWGLLCLPALLFIAIGLTGRKEPKAH